MTVKSDVDAVQAALKKAENASKLAQDATAVAKKDVELAGNLIDGVSLSTL